MVKKIRESKYLFHPLLAEKVASYVAECDAPVTYQDICLTLDLVGKDAQLELNACLDALDEEGRVVIAKNGVYSTPEKLGLMTGRVIGHRDGFGFLQVSPKSKDLYIATHQMSGLFHGDFILAKTAGLDKRGRREARLVRVLKTRTEAIVGRYFVEHGIGFVVPDDARIQQELMIEKGKNQGARHGQMVVVSIEKRPHKKSNAIGNVVEVIGDHMAPGMEIDVALRTYDIPHVWPKEIAAELSRIAEDVPEKAKLDRVDLRDLPLVTIDGEDARDFDDAVYCKPEQSGGWRLWVAIADVSYYVRPGTELDNEATQRGTSVYFPENVVPMLPEQLSNGLCSLNPHVDRLCMVCEMLISDTGTLSDYKFYPAVMNSHARLTYTKVGKILAGDEALRAQYNDLVPDLESLHQMYLALKVKRAERGAIEFETPEPRFIFNADRKIDSIELIVRNDAHKLIEESMILANVAAAQFIEKHQGQALFRVHEPPEGEKLTNFIGFLGELGISVNLDQEDISPDQYKKIVDRIDGRPDQELIQTMMLRSMKQAVYLGENLGHFGLALQGYAHFTSPIRRYPDLVLHRAIKGILAKQKQIQKGIGEYTYQAEDIDGLAEQTSMTERRADEATRDVANWLKCEFMRDHVGCTYAGVIAAVTSFGFFVRLNDLYIEGLVHIGSLKSDFYHFDNAKQRLVGERTRKVYKLGEEVVINVMSVNLDEKKIDFALAADDAQLDTIGLRSETPASNNIEKPRTRLSSSKNRKPTSARHKTKKVSKTQALMEQESKEGGKSSGGDKSKSTGNKPANSRKKPSKSGKPSNKKSSDKPSSKRKKPSSKARKKTIKRR